MTLTVARSSDSRPAWSGAFREPGARRQAGGDVVVVVPPPRLRRAAMRAIGGPPGKVVAQFRQAYSPACRVPGCRVPGLEDVGERQHTAATGRRLDREMQLAGQPGVC